MRDVLIRTAGLPHEEWLKIRKSGIGGTDVGAICGLNPYSSPIAVYQDKVSSEISDFDNEIMRQGRDFEDYLGISFVIKLLQAGKSFSIIAIKKSAKDSVEMR